METCILIILFSCKMSARILIVTERFHPEEFIINDLACELKKQGYAVGVLTQVPSYPYGRVYQGYPNRLFSSETWKDIRICRFLTITGYASSLAMKLLNYLNFVLSGTLAAFFTASKFDRILIYQTGPLTLAIPAIVAGKIFRKKVVIWTQDIWPDSVYAYGFKKTRFLHFCLGGIISFIYRNCSEILVSCAGFEDKIRPYAGKVPIKFCPNWPILDKSGNLESKAALSGNFNFTFAGNIGKLQNLENVLRGFALAVKNGLNATLNIIGDGSNLDNLRSIADKENIKGVIFWGRKKLQEMSAYFMASDVLIISLNDHPLFELTVPSKFQTYLAMGKPVFCVMNGEVKRITDDNLIGLSCAPADLNGIKAGFEKFASMPSGERGNMAANALALLRKEYDRKTIIGRITASLV